MHLEHVCRQRNDLERVAHQHDKTVAACLPSAIVILRCACGVVIASYGIVFGAGGIGGTRWYRAKLRTIREAWRLNDERYGDTATSTIITYSIIILKTTIIDKLYKTFIQHSFVITTPFIVSSSRIKF